MRKVYFQVLEELLSPRSSIQITQSYEWCFQRPKNRDEACVHGRCGIACNDIWKGHLWSGSVHTLVRQEQNVMVFFHTNWVPIVLQNQGHVHFSQNLAKMDQCFMLQCGYWYSWWKYCVLWGTASYQGKDSNRKAIDSGQICADTWLKSFFFDNFMNFGMGWLLGCMVSSTKKQAHACPTSFPHSCSNTAASTTDSDTAITDCLHGKLCAAIIHKFIHVYIETWCMSTCISICRRRMYLDGVILCTNARTTKNIALMWCQISFHTFTAKRLHLKRVSMDLQRNYLNHTQCMYACFEHIYRDAVG